MREKMQRKNYHKLNVEFNQIFHEFLFCGHQFCFYFFHVCKTKSFDIIFLGNLNSRSKKRQEVDISVPGILHKNGIESLLKASALTNKFMEE